MSEETQSDINPSNRALNGSNGSFKPDTVDLKSPVFEGQPGWGGQLKNWLSGNFRSVIIPLILIVIALFAVNHYWSKFILTSENINDDKNTGNLIEVVVSKGQGVTHLARTALDDYLNQNPQINLLPQQKLFIENYLTTLNKNLTVTIGQKISFSKEDISKAVEKALSLNQYQIKAWDKYISE